MNKQKLKFFLPIIIIVIVTVAVFWPALGGTFLNWDDLDQTVNNPLVNNLQWQTIPQIFSTTVLGMYQPLATLSFAIEKILFGFRPFFFHLDNLLLHIINCLLVFWLARRILKAYWPAFFASLIFAIHPLQVETVAWLSTRSNLLYSLFFISALIAYDYFDKKKLKKYFYLVIITFILACFSKPSAAVLPAVILAYDWLNHKLSWRAVWNKWPLYIISAGTILEAWLAKKDAVVFDFANYNLIERIYLPFYTLYQYIIKFVWPINLAPFYEFPDKIILLNTGLFLILATVLICIYLYKKKYRLTLFAILFFVICLSLNLNMFFNSVSFLFDRYMYLPILGLALGIGYLINKFWGKYKKLLFFVVIFLLLIYSAISFQQSIFWQNELLLWSNAYDNYPSSPTANWQLGEAYLRINKPNEAYSYLLQTVVLDNKNASAWNSLGLLKQNQFKQPRQAIYYYVRAGQTNHPGFFSSVFYYHASLSAYEIPDYQLALQLINTAIAKINPYDPNIYIYYFQRGKIFNSLGEKGLTMDNLNKALEYKPDNQEILEFIKTLQ